MFTHASPMDILARKSALVGQKSSDESAEVGLPRRARQADFRARILARKSARKSVSVSVSWNAGLRTATDKEM